MVFCLGTEGSKGSLFRIGRSEEHTSELQSRETISYAVFCLKKKKKNKPSHIKQPKNIQHRAFKAEKMKDCKAGSITKTVLNSSSEEQFEKMTIM